MTNTGDNNEFGPNVDTPLRTSANFDASTGPTQSTPEDVRARMRKPSTSTNRDDFTGDMVPLQIRVPNDLSQSLRLQSIMTGRTVSDLALEALTSSELIPKSWIQVRNAG